MVFPHPLVFYTMHHAVLYQLECTIKFINTTRLILKWTGDGAWALKKNRRLQSLPGPLALIKSLKVSGLTTENEKSNCVKIISFLSKMLCKKIRSFKLAKQVLIGILQSDFVNVLTMDPRLIVFLLSFVRFIQIRVWCATAARGASVCWHRAARRHVRVSEDVRPGAESCAAPMAFSILTTVNCTALRVSKIGT